MRCRRCRVPSPATTSVSSWIDFPNWPTYLVFEFGNLDRNELGRLAAVELVEPRLLLDDLVHREVSQPRPLRQDLTVRGLPHTGGTRDDNVGRFAHFPFRQALLR